MMNRFGKGILLFLTVFMIISHAVFAEEADSSQEKIWRIVIDPGHGDPGTGASSYMNGRSVREELLNLKIATYLKEALEKYENVQVYMTREEESNVDLEYRTEYALEKDADLLVSIHNNALGPNADYHSGSNVLVAKGQFKEDMAEEEQKLGTSILYELSQLGLENQGLLVRDSTNGEVYENDATADYYAIIRNGIKNDLLSVLVEHAFIDDESDYQQFLSSDEKLQSLALADAKGIARYLQLEDADSEEVLDELTTISQRFYYIKDDNPEHNEIYEEDITFVESPRDEFASNMKNFIRKSLDQKNKKGE